MRVEELPCGWWRIIYWIQAVSNCISMIESLLANFGTEQLLCRNERAAHFHLVHRMAGLTVSIWTKSWWLPSYHMMILCYMMWRLVLCLNFMTKRTWCVTQRLLPAAFCCESCTGSLYWQFSSKSLLTITFAFDNLFFCIISCLTSDCNKTAAA